MSAVEKDYGVLTTTALRRDRGDGIDSVREEAERRLIEREEAVILAEREAELEAKRPALIAEVQKAADGVRFTDELRECQMAVEDAWNTLGARLRALKDVRSDDAASRLVFKRARSTALRAGITEDELPDCAPEASKMQDLAPGIGEGGWPSRWGRG
jgi:hypothetical protein